MTSSARKLVLCIAVMGAAFGSLPQTASAAASDAACRYTKWRSFGTGYWKPNPEFTYEFNSSTIPAEQPGTRIAYDRTRFARRILSGAYTWSQGRNNCDFYQDGGVQILRRTDNGQRRADVWDDGINTVDLGGDINLRGTCPGDGKIACAHVRWRRVDGQKRIQEVDIRFNPRKRWWTGIRPVPSNAAGSPYDLWTLAAHEWGHAIGFGHVSEDKNAPPEVKAQLMYFQFGTFERRNRLQGSDYTAMCRVYPDC